MSDFCRACGASIPHREGEGRCPECIEHLPLPDTNAPHYWYERAKRADALLAKASKLAEALLAATNDAEKCKHGNGENCAECAAIRRDRELPARRG
jgi:hypothetical protein